MFQLIERKTEQMITDLKDKQIEIIALMNSWVFSRLIAENERAGETLAREMDTVAEAEREQGMSRFPLTLSPYAFCLPGTRALISESHALLFFSKPRAYISMVFRHSLQEFALTTCFPSLVW
jgi:hypothetical protein